MSAKATKRSGGKADLAAAEKRISLGRHERECGICNHGQREDIEQDVTNWKSPIGITCDYGLADRATVYRHAHAFNLSGKRPRTVRVALQQIIETAGDVAATAS